MGFRYLAGYCDYQLFRMPIMELNQHSASEYDYEYEREDKAWYLKNRRALSIALGILLLMILLICVIVAMRANVHGEQHSFHSGVLIWDENCPVQFGKCPESYEGDPILLMLSMDGFRQDFLQRGHTPVLERLSRCGAKADFMYSVYPTKTFPNHYSQVTGLHPDYHGIIDNVMHDPVVNETFRIGSKSIFKPFWWGGEPIWVTAEKQGKRAACYFWPGSEVKIDGVLPTYYTIYNSSVTFDARVDQVLEWMDLPKETRPSLITLYVNEPDSAEHSYGTSHEQTYKALARVDQMIERLLSGLQQRNLTDCVNVLFISDHGFSDIDCSRVVNIANYINVSNVHSYLGAFGRIRPNDDSPDAVANLLKELRCRNPHMRVFEKDTLPVRMHYSSNERIEPIILDVDPGWTIVDKDVKPGDETCSGGSHGYDNLEPDMRALFIATGPSFKRNMTFPAFMSVEIYEVLCELLNVTASPNNGTRGSLHHILRDPSPLETSRGTMEVPKVALPPTTQKEYNERVGAAMCPCLQPFNQSSLVDFRVTNSKHLPFGFPIFELEENIRLLYNDDYVAAYDSDLKMVLWSSYTITGLKSGSLEVICWIGDARIPVNESATCSGYNALPPKSAIQRPIYNPGFSDLSNQWQATFVTNSVPKSVDHTLTLEEEMNKMLSRWASLGELNVVSGPAFNLQQNGRRPSSDIMRNYTSNHDIAIPTHIYTVLTWCNGEPKKIKDCDPAQLSASSYLLPNQPYPHNCETADRVMKKNVARVRDVEALTGLTFYSRLPVHDAVRLRTMMHQHTISL